jgi:cytosine deaminase
MPKNGSKCGRHAADTMLVHTPFFSALREEIESLGGLFNAHLHLDRAGTLADTQSILESRGTSDGSSLSLPTKHSLIPAIHASRCYEPAHLRPRADMFLDLLIRAGTSRAATLIDVTDDQVGLDALSLFLELKRARAASLDLQVGAYSPLGFKASARKAWQLLEEGARLADFVASLPERDSRKNYPENIGFLENCRRMLQLGRELNKPVHFHVDQRNDPAENGAETLLTVMEELGIGRPSGGEPMVWLIHVVSPSTYDDARFNALVARMVALDVGVICCPSAAISMRQLRPVNTPTSNSIARVLEMLAAGVYLRLGSDNICDIASPAGTVDLVDELFVLCNAMRFFDLGILAKLGAGLRLNQPDIVKIREHLERDTREIADSINGFQPETHGVA